MLAHSVVNTMMDYFLDHGSRHNLALMLCSCFAKSNISLIRRISSTLTKSQMRTGGILTPISVNIFKYLRKSWLFNTRHSMMNSLPWSALCEGYKFKRELGGKHGRCTYRANIKRMGMSCRRPKPRPWGLPLACYQINTERQTQGLGCQTRQQWVWV